MNRNLLIVDDETEILEWLQELFVYDFDREIGVYTAKSAVEALSLLNRIRLDVVLTDIKMPGMDGITLFEKMKENWPRCKTVFLTGYRNFDDLYRIVSHRDVKYILKTEGDQTIMAAVRQSLDELEKELEDTRRQADEARYMEKARLWMRRDLMGQIFAGNPPRDVQSRLKQLGIELDVEKKILLCLLRVDNGSGTDGMDALKTEALIQGIRDNQPSLINLYLHPLDHRYATLLVQPSSCPDEAVGAHDANRLHTITEGMLEYAQEYFFASTGATFSAVLCPDPVALAELCGLVPVLRMHMNHFVGRAEGMLYSISVSDRSTEGGVPAHPGINTENLFRLMELRRETEYFDALRPFLEEMTRHESLRDSDALELYYTIAIRLLQFIHENRLNEDLAREAALYKLTSAEEHSSWIEAAQYLSDVSRGVFDLLEKHGTAVSNRLLSNVIDYIDTHLDGDLSLTRLAQVGGFNASYLSRLFKQITGQGPSEYILRKRLDLAKKLLAETNIKIQDIAAKAGYLSAHSFTRTFRAETGFSPTDWRNSAQKSSFVRPVSNQ